MSGIVLFLVLVRRTIEIHGMYSLTVVEVYVSCYAVELLTESNMSITQIAFSLGFGTIRSFNRAFRQETGMSPRDYWTQ